MKYRIFYDYNNLIVINRIIMAIYSELLNHIAYLFPY